MGQNAADKSDNGLVRLPGSPGGSLNSIDELADQKVPLLLHETSLHRQSDDEETGRERTHLKAAGDISEEEAALLQAGYIGETKRILRLSLPLSVTYVLSYGASLISMAFVGHIGAEAQAIAVLGTSFGNVTGYSILMGLSSAIDTLCGQAYGAKNYRLVGIILQRALLLQLVFFGVMWALWWKIGYILVLIGQEPVLSYGAQRYIHINALSLLFGGFNACLNKYLQSQGIVVPSMAALIFSTALCPVFNWILIFYLRLGIIGAPITNGIVNITSTILLVGVCIWHNRRVAGTEKQTWTGWHLKEAMLGWGAYLKLAIPNVVMQCLEWWLYEALIIIAGLSASAQTDVSVVGVGFNCSSFFFCMHQGLSGAAATRISNSLGAGFAAMAKRTCWIVFTMISASVAGMALGVWLLRNLWISIFTVDPDVISTLLYVMPIISWSLVGDGFVSVVAGVLRGTGRQAIGAGTNIFTYWVIGLPVVILLTFQAHLGILGIWLGLAITTSIQGAVMVAIISRFNWTELAERAALMVSSQVVLKKGEDAAGVPVAVIISE